MDPYRPLYVQAPREPPREPLPREDHALGILLIVVGAMRVIPAACHRERFGAEPTVALVMILIGFAIVISAWILRASWLAADDRPDGD